MLYVSRWLRGCARKKKRQRQMLWPGREGGPEQDRGCRHLAASEEEGKGSGISDFGVPRKDISDRQFHDSCARSKSPRY